MGAYWFKQPNGLYGRFSTIVDCPTHWNYTKKRMINYLKRSQWSDLEIEQLFNNEFPTNWIHTFEEMQEDFLPYNMTKKEFKELLKEMSLTKEELEENKD